MTGKTAMMLSPTEQLQNAYNQSSSFTTRHSTVSTEIFFDSWPKNRSLQWKSLPKRITCLVDHYLAHSELASSEFRSITLSNNPMEARRIALTASITTSAPRNFWDAWKRIFGKILKVHINHWTRIQEEDFIITVDDYVQEKLGFNEGLLFENLQTLQWLNAANPAVTDTLTRPLGEALNATISKYIESKITGEYEDESLFASLVEWKQSCLTPLLQNMLGTACYEKLNWDTKLNHILSQTFCTTRKNEIFDMVKDYPDSLPAIRDLHRALQQTHMTSQFIQALRDSFQRRLLHPGAQTHQILQVYMNTIKVLRVMDPTDNLLEGVAVGIRTYLRGRSDTVRCIISSLTDKQAGGDLYEELQRHDAVPLDQAQYDSDDDDEPPMLDWTPAPSLYYQRTSGASHQSVDSMDERGGDLLSMLVGIYGSNDLFVDEYRVRLADKLLANVDFDTDQEVHNLELLKLRFGETSMRQCEIMIKDMGDSKRVAANIHSTQKNTGEKPTVDAAIISHIFWPPLQKERLKNHPRIQPLLDQYSLEYAKYKNPRRLVWFSQLGQVQLEIDVIDEETKEMMTKDFTCSPLQATLISHFEDNGGRWKVSDLSNETGVAEDIIRKKIGYWINHRVIKAVVGNNGELVYELVSFYDASHGSDHDAADHVYEEDDDGLVVSLSEHEEEETKAFESYILGMLSNSGQLSLDRIHNNLKMFVTGSEHRYSMTPRQLSGFLQQMCKAEKIEYGAGGMYKILNR